MKIVIKGDVREIAALAVDIQEQKKESDSIHSLFLKVVFHFLVNPLR